MSLSEISEAEGRGGGQFTVLEESANSIPTSPATMVCVHRCSQCRPHGTRWGEFQLSEVSISYDSDCQMVVTGIQWDGDSTHMTYDTLMAV